MKEESKEKKQEVDSHSSKDKKTLREKIVYTSEQSKNNDYKEVINDNKKEKKILISICLQNKSKNMIIKN